MKKLTDQVSKRWIITSSAEDLMEDTQLYGSCSP